MHPRDIGVALPDRKRSKSAVERRAGRLRLTIGPVGRPSKPPPKPPPEPQIIVQPVPAYDPLLAEIGLTPKDWIALNRWAPGDPSQWPWRRQTGDSLQ
jgi:hypothetical protein